MKPSNPAPGHAHDEHYLDNEHVAHEYGDVNVRAILMFGLGLAAVTATVMLLMWGAFVGLERYAVSNDPQLSPLAKPAGELPPEPRLLLNEPQQLQTVQEAEAHTLSTYGWVDEAAGVARIPIAEAKKKLIEQGLPVREGAAIDPLKGTNHPATGESSSGRTVGAGGSTGSKGSGGSTGSVVR